MDVDEFLFCVIVIFCFWLLHYIKQQVFLFTFVLVHCNTTYSIMNKKASLKALSFYYLKSINTYIRLQQVCILILGIVIGRLLPYNNNEVMNNNIQTSTTSNTNGKVNDVLIDSSNKMNFDMHRDAMKYIIQPNRGYIPSKERISTWLPEVYGSYWWTNETVPESFSMAQLDSTYPATYFADGHPTSLSDMYTSSVLDVTALFMSNPEKKVRSLVEFGNGGGYFAYHFNKRLHATNDPTKFISVEGAGGGIAEAREKWNISDNQLLQHDLRLPLFIGHRYDVAVCTEVVEHVEPVFASQIVSTIVLHADVVWFSFKPDSSEVHRRAWINHPNERPLKMWTSLFDYYGYNIVMLPGQLTRKLYERGNFVAYKRDDMNIPKVTTADINAILPENLRDKNI